MGIYNLSFFLSFGRGGGRIVTNWQLCSLMFIWVSFLFPTSISNCKQVLCFQYVVYEHYSVCKRALLHFKLEVWFSFECSTFLLDILFQEHFAAYFCGNSLKIAVFWDVMMCSLVEVPRYFRAIVLCPSLEWKNKPSKQ